MMSLEEAMKRNYAPFYTLLAVGGKINLCLPYKNGQQLLYRLEKVKVPLEESEGIKIVTGYNTFKTSH
jgi:hypothetical protein